MSPQELEKMPKELEKIMQQLEDRVMADIVRRIKMNSEITRSADWQIYRLEQLGKGKEQIKEYIQEALNLSERQIDKLYNDAFEKEYVRNKDVYKIKGADFIPFSQNDELKQLIGAMIVQTKEQLHNISQSTGFIKVQGGSRIFTPLTQYYQDTLDNAIMDITTGVFDYNTVLKRTVNELTNSGLRSIEYASGRSYRIDSVVRTAVMTGISQVTGHISEQNAKDLGTEYFEVTAHGTARPSHQVWQGRVYTMQQLKDVCGYGTVTGLKGANCYHDFYPFFPGISERTYTDEELEEWANRENTPKEYRGKEYTTYEASQKQRKMELLMRKQRQDIKLLQEGGANEDEVISSKSRYRATMAEYADFSEKMGLPQQMDRVYGDGVKIKSNRETFEDKDVVHDTIFNLLTPGQKNITKQKDRILQESFNNDIIRRIAQESKINKITIGADTSSHYYGNIKLRNDYSDRTIRHEFGHAVDYSNKWLSETKEFLLAIEKDKKNIESNINLYQHIVNENKKMYALSDAMSGITKNKVKGRYWHNDAYWDKPKKLQREMFAQLFSVVGADDIKQLEILQKCFPNTFEVFSEIIGRLI